MSNDSESNEKRQLSLFSVVTVFFEWLFTDTLEDKSSGSKEEKELEELEELKNKIGKLDGEEKGNVLSNLREEFRAATAYSIHYSNARTALAVFFLGSSHIFLFTQLQKHELSIIILFGPFLMLMGYGIHFQLTRIMQSALKKLVEIERVLSFGEKIDNNIKPYFSSWAGNLGRKNGSAGDAVSEMFSKFYFIFVAVYLIFFVIGISVHTHSTTQQVDSILPNATYQFDGNMKVILEKSTN